MSTSDDGWTYETFYFGNANWPSGVEYKFREDEYYMKIESSRPWAPSKREYYERDKMFAESLQGRES